MTYGEKAAELKETLNCGQAVVVALADLAGLSEDKAKALCLLYTSPSPRD